MGLGNQKPTPLPASLREAVPLPQGERAYGSKLPASRAAVKTMSNGEAEPQAATRPTVFLSYSRADQAQARVLAQELEEAGLQVWWDTLIEGGAAFAKTIDAALDASDAVIVLWSVNSIASDWVLDEAARGRDLKKLVPLSIDGTEPPLGFRQYQSIALPPSPDHVDALAMQAVLRAVLPLAGREALPRATARPLAPTLAQVNVSRRGLLIGGGVVAVAAATGLAGWRRGWFSAAPAVGSSVAVLPFENLSGNPDQVYFSDGLSEEVRATLARNQKLKVMAQASSGTFRESDEGAVKIAAQLGVAFLLDGSVRWAGDTVRVAADLIDGSTGFSRWTQIFERRIDDVFAGARCMKPAATRPPNARRWPCSTRPSNWIPNMRPRMRRVRRR